MLGVALLAGIGFTVSLLIGELAFGAESETGQHVTAAVLFGSLISALLASVVLVRRNRVYKRIAERERKTGGGGRRRRWRRRPRPCPREVPMAPTDRSIGQLVSDALEDVRAIVQHEKALAKAEITRAAKRGGVGAGLLAAAVGLLSLSLVYLLIAAAEGLVEAGLARWAAYLVVGGVLLLLAVVLALVGVASLKKVKGPEKAVEQGRARSRTSRARSGDDDGRTADRARRRRPTVAAPPPRQPPRPGGD